MSFAAEVQRLVECVTAKYNLDIPELIADAQQGYVRDPDCLSFMRPFSCRSVSFYRWASNVHDEIGRVSPVRKDHQ